MSLEPKSLSTLPRPRGFPLLGNALQLSPETMHLKLEAWARELGLLYRLRIPGRTIVVVAAAEPIRQILRDRPQGFRRLQSFEPVFSELGAHGLFSAEGQAWADQRKIWLQSLSLQQLRGFHEQLQTVSARLLRRWQRAADAGEVLDVTAELMRYTVDVTMLFTLGTDSNTLEQGEDVLQQHIGQLFAIVGRRIAAPFPYWRYVKLPADRAVERALPVLRQAIDAIIASAQQRLAQDPERRQSPGCFVEALLVSRDSGATTLTDADVFANAMTALLAGEDTTANTLAWLVHFCTQSPTTWAALRSEADALLDAPSVVDRHVPQAGDFPHLLPHTDGAINETLRLTPVAPLYFLTSLRPTMLSGVTVPAGCDVILLPRAAAGAAPGDVPTPRFAPQPAASPGSAATLPFGFGPRVCPGRNLAMAELRSVALMLARNFELEAVPGEEPVREVFKFTLVPQNLRVRLHRRAGY